MKASSLGGYRGITKYQGTLYNSQVVPLDFYEAISYEPTNTSLGISKLRLCQISPKSRFQIIKGMIHKPFCFPFIVEEWQASLPVAGR